MPEPLKPVKKPLIDPVTGKPYTPPTCPIKGRCVGGRRVFIHADGTRSVNFNPVEHPSHKRWIKKYGDYLGWIAVHGLAGRKVE